ncbi:unnamed protein product [Sympodiomycopsis kandeliae]
MASSEQDAPEKEAYHLPASLIQDTFKRSALQYKTRGLTSNIHTYSLSRSNDTEQLQLHLRSLRASSSLLVVKSVDLEEQVRPHDIKLEIQLLSKLNTKDERSQYVLQLLDTAQESPDDFTSIQRLYFPHYPLDLSEWLDQDATTNPGGTNQVERGYKLATQLYSALAYLHSQNVYHRDIKPSNILLTTDDILSETCQIKLCDFGTGVHIPDSHQRAKTCSTSTHPYTPPELLFSPKYGYDAAKVDVWEASCVLAEIFGPTEADEQQQQQQQQQQQAPNRKRSHQDDDDEQVGDEDADAFWGAPLSSSSQNNLQLFTDNGEEDDEDEDEFWVTTSSNTSQPFSTDNDQWKSLQRTLFSSASGADDTWLKRGTPHKSALGPSVQASRPAPTVFHRKHRPLFPRSNPNSLGGNDISLATSHFQFCGLPTDQDLWPESKDYQPSFERMPFKRCEQAEQPNELLARCTLLRGDEKKVQVLVQVLLGCLELSPGKRLEAQKIQDLLQGID